jgi:chromosome segregation ATPase
MTNTGMIAAASLIAAAVVGGAIAMRPTPPKEDARAAIDRTIARTEDRIAALEARIEKAERERAASERQAADALSMALELQKEVDLLRGQTDDIMAALATTGSNPRAAGGRKASSGGEAAPEAVALGAPAPEGPAASGGDTRLAARGAELAPPEVAVVKQALEQIRKEEAEQQRAEREARRKEFQQQRLAVLTERLGLSPAQVEKLGAIWDEADAKRQELFQTMREGGLDRGEMREAMAAIRQQVDQQLQETLTTAQYTEYQKIREEEQPTRGGGPFGSGFGGGGRGGRFPAPAGTSTSGGGQ